MNLRVLLLLVALSTPAFAYLDPITGNLLVQALMAGVAAIALGYHRLKATVQGMLGKKEEPEKDDPKKVEEESPPAEGTPGQVAPSEPPPPQA